MGTSTSSETSGQRGGIGHKQPPRGDRRRGCPWARHCRAAPSSGTHSHRGHPTYYAWRCARATVTVFTQDDHNVYSVKGLTGVRARVCVSSLVVNSVSMVSVLHCFMTLRCFNIY